MALMIGEIRSTESEDKRVLVLKFLKRKNYPSSKGRVYLSINFKQNPVEGSNIPPSGVISIKSSLGVTLFEISYDRSKLISPTKQKEYWAQLNPESDPYVVQLRIADNSLDPDDYILLRVNVYLPTLDHRPDILEYLNKECSVMVERLVNLPKEASKEKRDEIEEILSI